MVARAAGIPRRERPCKQQQRRPLGTRCGLFHPVRAKSASDRGEAGEDPCEERNSQRSRHRRPWAVVAITPPVALSRPVANAPTRPETSAESHRVSPLPGAPGVFEPSHRSLRRWQCGRSSRQIHDRPKAPVKPRSPAAPGTGSMRGLDQMGRIAGCKRDACARDEETSRAGRALRVSCC
jgi:hypothetical protein